jgi:hypothetical protein
MAVAVAVLLEALARIWELAAVVVVDLILALQEGPETHPHNHQTVAMERQQILNKDETEELDLLMPEGVEVVLTHLPEQEAQAPIVLMLVVMVAQVLHQQLADQM